MIKGFAGCLFAYIIKKGHNIYVLRPIYPDETNFYIFLVEMCFTALFMMINVHVKYEKLCIVKNTLLKNLLVVLSLYAIIGMIGKIDEACLNPVLGITVIVF